MKRILRVSGLILAALFLAGCGPIITVQNNTSIPVRAIVTSGGKSEVLSPSPGESSSAEASEGVYSVTVIPDAEWIEYAQATRKYLNEQLADSDKLTGEQLLDVIRRLKDIAARMQQYEKAGSGGGRCSGRVTEDSSGMVQINIAADGSLMVSCQ